MEIPKIDFVSDINKGYEAALSYPSADRFIVKIHWWFFVATAVLAFINSVVLSAYQIPLYFPSPFAWRILSLPEASVAVLIAFIAAILPALTVGKFKNHYYWRILITLTLSFIAYVIVFLAGGAIEMHFIFFAMIALVAIYADWRLGWIMLVAVALHHGILNYVAPTWVYFYGRNDFSVVAHGLPVVVEVIFTTILCNMHRTTIQQIQELRTDLNALNKEIGMEDKA